VALPINENYLEDRRLKIFFYLKNLPFQFAV
ncbi:uncharacterized protein METZ01_LOCUS504747, partial [marine metagenome]